MQTYLIVSTSLKFIEKKIEKFKTDLNIKPYSFYESTPSPSIGIEEVRKIIHTLITKPFQSKNRLITITEFDKATVEAQNALLKVLEEPPSNTYFILGAHRLERILKTVISRCQIITDLTSYNVPDELKLDTLLHEIITSHVFHRVELAMKLSSSSEDALSLLDKFLVVLHQHFFICPQDKKISPRYLSQMITKIESAKSYIEKNVNFKAVLEVLFLGLGEV